MNKENPLYDVWRKKMSERRVLPEANNPYAAIVRRAQADAESFYQRQEVRVTAWYETHTECKQLLLPLNWNGVQVRGSESIDVSQRYGSGWFERVVSRDAHAPEHRLAQVEEYSSAIEQASAMATPAYQAVIKQAFKESKVGRRVRVVDARQMAFDLGM